MSKLILFVQLLGIFSAAAASLSGPFMFWGNERLETLKLPALASIDENDLSNLYKEAKSIVLFIRNTTSRLDGENFPSFKELISKNRWIYLPQHNLPAEPLDYNANVEVITLVGPASQQDTEIASLFKDAVSIYGEGEVLGILATKEDEGHFMYKREAEEPTSTAVTPTEESTVKDFIYNAPGKALLLTSSAPVLSINASGVRKTFELLEHDKEITFDNRTEWSRLNVGFKVNNTRLRLRFNFTLSQFGYWELSAVEVEYKEYNNILPIAQLSEISAPVGFSYRCSAKPLVFKDDEDHLTIHDYQVQPWLKGTNRFSDAYDCVGFVTIPILSGLFVSSILIGVAFIGIIALMELKTPSRFESSRNKQLAFNVQD